MKPQHKRNINRTHTKPQSYNVKVYHCNNCGHIFHTTKIGLDFCTKCYMRSLLIIDKYKSKKPPRASGLKGKWLTKWSIYEHKSFAV